MHSRPLINVGKVISTGRGGGGGGEGEGMGDLVWVRIFSKLLEIESPYIIIQH